MPINIRQSPAHAATKILDQADDEHRANTFVAFHNMEQPVVCFPCYRIWLYKDSLHIACIAGARGQIIQTAANFQQGLPIKTVFTASQISS